MTLSGLDLEFEAALRHAQRQWQLERVERCRATMATALAGRAVQLEVDEKIISRATEMALSICAAGRSGGRSDEEVIESSIRGKLVELTIGNLLQAAGFHVSHNLEDITNVYSYDLLVDACLRLEVKLLSLGDRRYVSWNRPEKIKHMLDTWESGFDQMVACTMDSNFIVRPFALVSHLAFDPDGDCIFNSNYNSGIYIDSAQAKARGWFVDL